VFLSLDLAEDCQRYNGEHVVGTMVINPDTTPRFERYRVVSFDHDATMREEAERRTALGRVNEGEPPCTTFSGGFTAIL
jgi:hypothetical protein